MMKTLHFTILLFITSQCIVAQNFLVRNVTLFDGEQLIENASVRVEDGRVTEISNSITFQGEVIDGSGKFLMPAMTNCHVHAFNAFSLLEAAKAGVLNVLDMHGVERMQSQMTRLNDSTNFARYFFAGAAATVPEGHGTQYGFPTPTLTTPEEAADFVTQRKSAGAHYIKIIVEPWKPTLSYDIVKALIDQAHRNKLKAVVHVSKQEDAVQVLQHNADGLVHLWRDRPMEAKTLKMLASEKDFFVVPTLLTTTKLHEMMRSQIEPGTVLSDEALLKEVFRVHSAGIPVLAGTDPPNANINYGTDLYKELKLLSDAGIPAIDVLKSATSLPATYFELPDTGFIKVGYFADMLLLTANPIEAITNIDSIQTIWKAGKIVEK